MRIQKSWERFWSSFPVPTFPNRLRGKAVHTSNLRIEIRLCMNRLWKRRFLCCDDRVRKTGRFWQWSELAFGALGTSRKLSAWRNAPSSIVLHLYCAANRAFSVKRQDVDSDPVRLARYLTAFRPKISNRTGRANSRESRANSRKQVQNGTTCSTYPNIIAARM